MNNKEELFYKIMMMIMQDVRKMRNVLDENKMVLLMKSVGDYNNNKLMIKTEKKKNNKE